jgi:hypothetical protein
MLRPVAAPVTTEAATAQHRDHGAGIDGACDRLDADASSVGSSVPGATAEPAGEESEAATLTRSVCASPTGAKGTEEERPLRIPQRPLMFSHASHAFDVQSCLA